jgi:hypothetical protein
MQCDNHVALCINDWLRRQHSWMRVNLNCYLHNASSDTSVDLRHFIVQPQVIAKTFLSYRKSIAPLHTSCPFSLVVVLFY